MFKDYCSSFYENFIKQLCLKGVFPKRVNPKLEKKNTGKVTRTIWSEETRSRAAEQKRKSTINTQRFHLSTTAAQCKGKESVIDSFEYEALTAPVSSLLQMLEINKTPAESHRFGKMLLTTHIQ
ncbi:hypothetical protein AMECASPLE_000376 [Ameca splendens]|uniref:Uncharacterized protein n=1 Tax=Ameca splendens TaxID=208324 RepID=A0ABV0ZTV5_9TELE